MIPLRLKFLPIFVSLVWISFMISREYTNTNWYDHVYHMLINIPVRIQTVARELMLSFDRDVTHACAPHWTSQSGKRNGSYIRMYICTCVSTYPEISLLNRWKSPISFPFMFYSNLTRNLFKIPSISLFTHQTQRRSKFQLLLLKKRLPYEASAQPYSCIAIFKSHSTLPMKFTKAE